MKRKPYDARTLRAVLWRIGVLYERCMLSANVYWREYSGGDLRRLRSQVRAMLKRSTVKGRK